MAHGSKQSNKTHQKILRETVIPMSPSCTTLWDTVQAKPGCVNGKEEKADFCREVLDLIFPESFLLLSVGVPALWNRIWELKWFRLVQDLHGSTRAWMQCFLKHSGVQHTKEQEDFPASPQALYSMKITTMYSHHMQWTRCPSVSVRCLGEPQNHIVWRENAQRSPISGSKQSQYWIKTGLFRALARQTLEISKDEVCTTFLGNLLWSLAILMVERFSLISCLDIPYLILWPLSCSLTMGRAWLLLLSNFFRRGKMQGRSLKVFFSLSQTGKVFPQSHLMQQMLPPQIYWWPFA